MIMKMIIDDNGDKESLQLLLYFHILSACRPPRPLRTVCQDVKGKISPKGLQMVFLTRKESNGPKNGPITAKNVPKAAGVSIFSEN